MPAALARFLFAPLASAAILAAEPAFLIPTHEVAAGGGRSESSRFEIISSINQISSVEVGQSVAFADRRGYIGQLNEAPAPLADQYVIHPRRSLKILISEILANDTDTDDPLLELSAIAPTSARGVPLTILGDWIIYPGTLESDDSFNYTVTDGIDESTGVILLSNEPPVGVTLNIILVRDGSDNLLNVFGIPGRAYQIQSTESLTAPIVWSNLGGPTFAPAHGLIQHRDVAPPGTRFYRAIEP